MCRSILKRNRLGRKGYKMYHLRRKETQENGMESSPVFKKKERSRFKKNHFVEGNKDRGDVRTRSHPTQLPPCEKKLNKS